MRTLPRLFPPQHMPLSTTPDLHEMPVAAPDVMTRAEMLALQEDAVRLQPDYNPDQGSGGQMVARHLENRGEKYVAQARFTLKPENGSVEGVAAAAKVNDVIVKLKTLGISATDPSAHVVQQGEMDVYYKNGHEVLALDSSYYHVQLAIRELREAGLETTLEFVRN